MALDRVRLARPKVVLIENLVDQEVVSPISEFVTRIEGYRWRGAVLEPHLVAGYTQWRGSVSTGLECGVTEPGARGSWTLR